MKTILFYGDSNTWGFDPQTGGRYPFEKRWTSVCENILGECFNCIPAGMNGRTTIFDDPLKGCRNGIEGLDYELQSRKPIDIFVLMLGTNDLKYTNAKGSMEGMDVLLEKIVTANERFNLSSPVFTEEAKILLISPVLVLFNIDETGKYNSIEESKKISGLYQALANKYNIEYMDAKEVTEPSPTDGTHLGIDGHEKLGIAVAEKIKQII